MQNFSIRDATVLDWPQIFDLAKMFPDAIMLNHLPAYKCFSIAEKGGGIVGCCPLEIYNGRMCEVRSPLVHPDHEDPSDPSIYLALIRTCIAKARAAKIIEICTVTDKKDVFEQVEFHNNHGYKFAMHIVLADEPDDYSWHWSNSFSEEIVFRPAAYYDWSAIEAIIRKYPNELMQKYLPRCDEFFVAAKGEEIIGCCALEVYSGRMCEVRSLAVVPEYGGRGIGPKLVKSCIAKARRLGIVEICTVTNRKELFESVGFHTFHKQKWSMFIVLADEPELATQ